MTPKEKSNELVKRFYKYAKPNSSGFLVSNEDVYIESAKQCALIAVEALIKENEQIEEMVGQGFNLDFWQQVKTEIEQL